MTCVDSAELALRKSTAPSVLEGVKNDRCDAGSRLGIGGSLCVCCA